VEGFFYRVQDDRLNTMENTERNGSATPLVQDNNDIAFADDIRQTYRSLGSEQSRHDDVLSTNSIPIVNESVPSLNKTNTIEDMQALQTSTRVFATFSGSFHTPNSELGHNHVTVEGTLASDNSLADGSGDYYARRNMAILY
jgi:hypothetical protein